MSATTTQAPTQEAEQYVRDLLESVVLEDGLATAIELAEHPELIPGANPVTVQVIIGQLLIANAFGRLKRESDPFDAQTPDVLFTPDELSELDASDECDDESVADRQGRLWEETVRAAHSVINTAGAVRALSTAQFARWDVPHGEPAHAEFTQHPLGFNGEFAGDELAAGLRLGVVAGEQLVRKSAWMVTKTPLLLDDVATGAANLDTVAAVATELQDASPATCELVEKRIRARNIHQRAMAPARKSARTLVTKFEAGSARETHRQTKAQQIGAWLDPHPTAGLATFSATLPDAQAAHIMDLVEMRARELQQDHERDGDSSGPGGKVSRYLGLYRADAIYEIVTRNLAYKLEVHVLDPIGNGCGADCTNRASEAAPVADPTGSSHASPSTIASRSSRQDEPAVDPSSVFHASSSAAAPWHSRPDEPAGWSADAPSADASTGVSDKGSSGSTPDSNLRASAFASGAPGVSSSFVLHDRLGAVSGDSFEALRRGASEAKTTPVAFDPVTGQLIVTATSQAYRPPASMRRRVQARDRHCRAPGCHRPAEYADLDHVVAWPRGSTTDTNLECLCRRHHRMKQAGWQVTMAPNGVCTWTTRLGRQYVTEPGILESYWDTADLDQSDS